MTPNNLFDSEVEPLNYYFNKEQDDNTFNYKQEI